MSPTLFNVVMDNFIRTWMAMTAEYHRVVRDGFGEAVGGCLGVFYINDGIIGSRDPDWLQNFRNVMVDLF